MKKWSALVILLVVVVFSACLSHKKKGNYTFCDNVAPIVYQKCTPCHRPGQSGPFSLITYNDFIDKLKTNEYVIVHKIMPPWPADPSYSHFANENYLTDDEIDIIKTWAENGAPMGDQKHLPAPPVFPEGSKFGKPNLVLKMLKPYRIAGNNRDHFIVFKLPYELPKDTFIRLIEFVPDNVKLLHHMNGHLIQYKPGAKKNIYQGLGYANEDSLTPAEVHEKLDLANDDGTYPMLTPSVVNYLPGVTDALYPEGIGGYHMAKQGALYINDIHYGPSPVEDSDQSYFNIFFASKPPKRPVAEFQMGTLGISPVIPSLVIPADSVKTFHTEFRVPRDISLLTINPHMHLLGKSFLAYALLPNGDTIHLIKINNWDFHWQYYYTFKKMVKIPAGTLLYAQATYDNTANNPNNPYSPPRTVSDRNGSMRTTDEMFQLIVTYIPYQAGDENIRLDNTYIRKVN